MAEQVARGHGGHLSQTILRWPSTGGRRQPRVASGCGGRRAFFLGSWGSKWTPTVAVAAPTTERGRSASSRATHGRGRGNGLWPLSAGPGADKGDARAVRVGTFRTHKSETRMDIRERVRTTLSAGPCALSTCYMDTFGSRVVVLVGPMRINL
jgi:hypothetical protein